MKNEFSSKKSLIKDIQWRTYTMIFALIIIAIFFQVITNGIFFKPRNFSNLIRQMSITGVIAVGTVLMIVSGNFDLAVGSIVGLTGGIAAILQVKLGFSTPVAILGALLAGLFIGLWQGFWVAYRKVPSFIVTLGGLMIFRGLYLVITDGITITPISRNFVFIGQGFISQSIGIFLGLISLAIMIFMFIHTRKSRIIYGFSVSSKWLMFIQAAVYAALIILFIVMLNGYNGIPIPVIIFVSLIIIFTFISKKTKFGRNVYAIGGNKEAARLSGINVEKNVMRLYIITGFLSAISGVLLTARMAGATASAGTSFEMDVISACVLGGTSLSGGRGSIVGAVIGALIIASLDNGMSLMNLSYNYQNMVKGLVLILAVWFDVSNQIKK